MILLKKAKDLADYLRSERAKGREIGFVPTMGALHAGHISLVENAKNDNCVVIASIFVNPTQFNDPSDYNKYPITIDHDIFLLESNGCDALFLPSVAEIYPDGPIVKKDYDLGYLDSILEGKYRPGHFKGVCAVVEQLLQIVDPHHLYIGQKDYQQCMVITRLVALMGKTGQSAVHICPTLREESGLAMSSRNMRLSADDKQTAAFIYQILSSIKKDIKPGNIELLKQKAAVHLSDNGFKVDYIEIADAETLSPVNIWDGKQKLVALIAAFLHEVRLIDNILLNPY